MNTLTALLALTPAQQPQAVEIFTVAVESHGSIKTGIRPLRVTLGAAVRANDTVGISQAAASISLVMGQSVSNGALANAAFFQLLTPARLGTQSQFSS